MDHDSLDVSAERVTTSWDQLTRAFHVEGGDDLSPYQYWEPNPYETVLLRVPDIGTTCGCGKEIIRAASRRALG